MTNFSSVVRTAVAMTCLLALSASAARAGVPADAPADAEGDAARARARALLQEGARYMDERRYDRAVESFTEAYRLVPSPKVLYNLGVAYLSVARYADALDALERFLAEATDAPAANQETARRHVADLRAKVTTLSFTSQRPRAELILDGRSLGELALDRDLTIDAGPHDLRAIADGRVVDQRLTAPAGGRLSVALAFDAPPPLAAPALAPPAPVPAPPSLVAAPDERRPLVKRPWFWIAAGGAVAITTIILVVALSHTDYPPADQTVSQ